MQITAIRPFVARFDNRLLLWLKSEPTRDSISETLVQEALVELLSEGLRRVVCVGRLRVRRRQRRAAVGSSK